MGEPEGGAQPDAAALEALRRKLEELEALGVPTEGLRKTLEERPQDFEREAEEALRRELQGDIEPKPAPPGEAPVEPPGAPPPAPAEGAPPPPTASPEPAAIAPPGGEAAGPESPQTAPAVGAPGRPTPEGTPLEVPGDSELAQLEATVAALVGEAPPPSPAPQVLEAPQEAPEAVEAELADELERALESAPPAAPPSPLAEGQAPPLLAGGDSLSLARAPEVPPAPSAQPPPPTLGVKPPPPSAVAALSAGAKPVVRVSGAPPGAKPMPTAAAAPASEVLPVTHAGKRGYLTPLIAGALVIGLFAATYLLLLNGPPTVAFSVSPSSPAAGDLVLFSANNTTDPNGDPVTFLWQFGDGSNTTGRVAFHTYARSGDFTVTLTATDDHGNAASLPQALRVASGTVVPPAYRYGDTLAYAVVGSSHIEGSPAPTPLATVNFKVGGLEQSCNVEAVDLRYEGPQTRSVLSLPQTVTDGFLVNRPTFALERSFPDLALSGQVNTTCQNAPFQGTSTVLERTFLNPQNNDTIRSETDETTEVRVATEPPTDFSSGAHLTRFGRLADAADQLHFEAVYAGRAFSTEGVDNGTFSAEGLTWSWLTQGTEVVRGHLAVKVHFETNQPPRLPRLTVDLWVSSASSFPLKEAVFVRIIDIGRITQSTFTATSAAEPVTGTSPILFGDGTRAYPPVNASELAPLGEVPRSSLSADFAMTARSAFDQARNASVDFGTFMAANPSAYAVNGTYARSGGNPKWMLEFSFGPTGETKRCEVEQSTSTQVRCTGGSVNAAATRSALGDAVSLNYAADLMKREPTAGPLFPSSSFDASRANFTVQQDLRVPGLSLDAAGSASRQSVPYAFGAESHASEPTRVTAAVDAQTGQLLFVLSQSGDKLP